MFYVVKKGESIDQYHAKYHNQHAARDYALSLKETLGHNYDVIHVSTVWTTQTLDEAMKKTG